MSYGSSDNLGEQLGVLDPIDDPAGGYLGVYHTPFGKPAGATSGQFRISLAHSDDLIHWTRVRVLDPVGAAMPTLRRIPGSAGYLLAYEKAVRPTAGDVIRVRYYASRGALSAGRFAVQRDLPQSFSDYNNGTPSFLSIDWRRGPSSSVIELGYHYETKAHGQPGPDRQAVGKLVGFRRWITRKDRTIDSLLDQEGVVGNHGDRRQFRFNGEPWRVYEAQDAFGDFSRWHVFLYDPAKHRMLPLTLSTARGVFSTSFGAPVVQVERAPSGKGRVLVVTMFVYSAGEAAREPGELVYYAPI